MVLVAGTQLPAALEQSMPGLVAVGKSEPEFGAAPGAVPVVGEGVRGGGGRRRVLGHLADQAVGGGAGVLPVDVVAPEPGAAGVAGLFLGQRRPWRGAVGANAVDGLGPGQGDRPVGADRDRLRGGGLRLPVGGGRGDLVAVGARREGAAGAVGRRPR